MDFKRPVRSISRIKREVPNAYSCLINQSAFISAPIHTLEEENNSFEIMLHNCILHKCSNIPIANLENVECYMTM